MVGSLTLVHRIVSCGGYNQCCGGQLLLRTLHDSSSQLLSDQHRPQLCCSVWSPSMALELHTGVQCFDVHGLENNNFIAVFQSQGLPVMLGLYLPLLLYGCYLALFHATRDLVVLLHPSIRLMIIEYTSSQSVTCIKLSYFI